MASSIEWEIIAMHAVQLVDQHSCEFGSLPLMVLSTSKTVQMKVFAPFILIYIPEHQFTSTVFVSKMCVMVTFHFSFHFNVRFCAFPFFCRRRRGTCLLTYCTVLRRQLFSINLQLLNIFYKELSCCFSFPSFV